MNELDDDNNGVVDDVLAYQSITDPVEGTALIVADPGAIHDVRFAGVVDITEGKLFTVTVMLLEVAVVLLTETELKLVVITTVITSLLRILSIVNDEPLPALIPFFFH